MAEHLFVIEKIGTAQSVCDLSLAQYKISRETDKRWYLNRYAEEFYIEKSRALVFTTLEAAGRELKKMKARQLAEARKLVELLSQEVSIKLIAYPHQNHIGHEGPIEL